MNSIENITIWNQFSSDSSDFNFELSPLQILSEVNDMESLHTQIFNIECENQDVQMLPNITKENIKEFDDQISVDSASKSQICNIDISVSNSLRKSAEEREKYNFSNAIDDHLHLIFHSKKDKCSSLSNRRDVINKAILRGFKKFFVNLFNTPNQKIKVLSKESIRIHKSSVLDKARLLGLYDLCQNQDQRDDYDNFIYWLSFPKITQKIMSLSENKSSTISLFHDLLMSYSHQKLYKMFENKVIMNLFKYFIAFGKEMFLEGIQISKLTHQNSANIRTNMKITKDLEAYEEGFQIFASQASL